MEVQVLAGGWETDDVYAFRTERPEGFTFEPGQFCMLSPDGMDPQAYSIASGRQDDHLLFATKQTPSRFTDALCSLGEGDRIGLKGPYGRFALGDHDPVALLTGGIGITPFLSMAATAAQEAWDRRIHLVYSNHSPDDAAFRADLDRLADEAPGLEVTHTLTGVARRDVPEGCEAGRIDAGLLERLGLLEGEWTWFVCGSPGMVRDLAGLLEGLGVPKARVHTEGFTGY